MLWSLKLSNQSILKKINPEYSLEGLMLKLKLQYFGHLMQRANSLEKTQILGNIEGMRRRRWQRKRLGVGRHHWLDGHEFGEALGDGEGQGSLVCCSPWGHKESDVTERLNNNKKYLKIIYFKDFFQEFSSIKTYKIFTFLLKIN